MEEVKNIEIRTMLGWALALILAWFFVTSGYPKINPTEAVSDRFISWGYSSEFAQLIGITEVLCGLIILVPKLRFWSGLILLVNMAGAIYTHFTTGIGSPAFAIILSLILIVIIILSYPNALLLAKNNS